MTHNPDLFVARVLQSHPIVDNTLTPAIFSLEFLYTNREECLLPPSYETCAAIITSFRKHGVEAVAFSVLLQDVIEVCVMSISEYKRLRDGDTEHQHYAILESAGDDQLTYIDNVLR